jgi:hypothetical protein
MMLRMCVMLRHVNLELHVPTYPDFPSLFAIGLLPYSVRGAHL